MEEGSDILQITGNSTDVLLVQVKDSNSYKVYKDNIADVESAYHLSWTVQRSTEGVSVLPVTAG